MSLNSGGRQSARTIGRSAPRLSGTTRTPSSVGVIARVFPRLTNVIFKHPASARLDKFAVAVNISEITTVTPATGLAAGGTAIIVRGDRFVGATSVTVGGVACTAFVLVDDNRINCTTAAHAVGAVDVVVVNPVAGNGTKVAGYTYT